MCIQGPSPERNKPSHYSRSVRKNENARSRSCTKKHMQWNRSKITVGTRRKWLS